MNTTLRIIILALLAGNQFLIGQNTILWSIENTATQKKSYLLGTFHQIGNSFIDSIPQIKEFLLESDFAYFESIEDSKKLITSLNNRVSDNSYLRYLKKKDIDFLLDISKTWGVSIDKLNPIEILIKLNQEYILTHCKTVKNTDKWKHFEKYLISIALENNLKLFGLENDSIQTKDINLIGNNLTWENAENNIHRSIINIKKSTNKKSICYGAHQYMNFSIDYQFEEKCGDASLSQRNTDWIKTLVPALKRNNLFIAVGIFHLYGECGLIIQLRKLGYIINPIKLK